MRRAFQWIDGVDLPPRHHVVGAHFVILEEETHSSMIVKNMTEGALSEGGGAHRLLMTVIVAEVVLRTHLLSEEDAMSKDIADSELKRTI